MRPAIPPEQPIGWWAIPHGRPGSRRPARASSPDAQVFAMRSRVGTGRLPTVAKCPSSRAKAVWTRGRRADVAYHMRAPIAAHRLVAACESCSGRYLGRTPRKSPVAAAVT
jgi:hypothetical protein